MFIIIVGGDRIKKIVFIKQESQSDCGIACLKCVLSYYNIYPTSEYLKDTSLYDGTGVTLFGLKNVFESLGFDSSKNISFDDILNKEFKIVTNNDYYKKLGNNFIPTSNYDEVYNNDNSITVKIKAIIRGKEDKEMFTNQALIFYTGALVDKIVK